MILSCPSCATRYSVEPAALGREGRTVRCAKCRHSWFQAPPDDLPKSLEVADSPPIPAALAAGPEEIDDDLFAEDDISERRGRGHGWIGWTALLLIVVVLVGGGYFARHKIVAVWPPAATLYAMIDPTLAPVNTLGIELRDVTAKFTREQDGQVLLVTGKIASISDLARPIPRIRINLLDKAEKEIFHWTFSADKAELGPRETISFSSRLADPPAKIAGLEATFVAQKGPAGASAD